MPGRPRPKSLGHTLHWFAYVGQEPEFEPDCYDYDDSGTGSGPQRYAPVSPTFYVNISL